MGRCRLNPGRPRFDRAWFQRLKLTYDEALSNFAFNFNLRRYIAVLLQVVVDGLARHHPADCAAYAAAARTSARLRSLAAALTAGAATPDALITKALVALGRAMQVDPMKVKLKPPGNKRFETKI